MQFMKRLFIFEKRWKNKKNVKNVKYATKISSKNVKTFTGIKDVKHFYISMIFSDEAILFVHP